MHVPKTLQCDSEEELEECAISGLVHVAERDRFYRQEELQERERCHGRCR